MSILGFGFNSGKIESGRNRIGFKMGIVWVEFGLSIFESLRFGFELGRVILDVGNFGSCYNSGFVRLWIDLLRVFGSKWVHPISGVSSRMDPCRSVRDSGLESVLSGLVLALLGFMDFDGSSSSAFLSTTTIIGSVAKLDFYLFLLPFPSHAHHGFNSKHLLQLLDYHLNETTQFASDHAYIANRDPL